MKIPCLIFVLTLACPPVLAADWQACKKTKLEALQLDDALRRGSVLRGYRNRSQMRATLRDRDKWLWRNCRRYSGELRELAIR